MTSADGARNKDYRWRCRGCKQMFTVRTGTIFEESRLPLRVWVYAFWRACASKKGISALQLSREMQITHKSALFVLRHDPSCQVHQTPQPDGEPAAFIGSHRVDSPVQIAAAEDFDLAEQSLSSRAETDLDTPPVLGLSTPDDQASTFEAVDKPREGGRREADGLAQHPGRLRSAPQLAQERDLGEREVRQLPESRLDRLRQRQGVEVGKKRLPGLILNGTRR